MIERERQPDDWTRRLSGRKVLVIDDDVDVRTIIEVVLRRAGADVVSAGSGAEAIASFERSAFDMIVSDIAMPDQDGFAILEKIRSIEASGPRKTPVIALTAYHRPDVVKQLLARGFDRCLKKPFEPDALIQEISSVVESR